MEKDNIIETILKLKGKFDKQYKRNFDDESMNTKVYMNVRMKCQSQGKVPKLSSSCYILHFSLDEFSFD